MYDLADMESHFPEKFCDLKKHLLDHEYDHIEYSFIH